MNEHECEYCKADTFAVKVAQATLDAKWDEPIPCSDFDLLDLKKIKKQRTKMHNGRKQTNISQFFWNPNE